MSDRLFKRGARVTAYRSSPLVAGGFSSQNPGFFQPLPNAIIIENLRVRGKVEKSIDRSPNKCEITISNCAPDTRALLQSKPLRLMIECGYDGDLRHVITGDARHGTSKYVDGDWETTVQFADGDRAYRYAAVSRSYPKGTSVVVALKDAAAAMGLQLPSDVTASPDLRAQVATGRALDGPVRDELTRLLAPYGYHWSIQDGQLHILKDQSAGPGTAFLIAESTGMIGSPEYALPDKAGQPPTLKVQSLLYTALTGGALIQVQSENINGFFRANRITHTFDTHGDPWTTDIEASPSPQTRAA